MTFTHVQMYPEDLFQRLLAFIDYNLLKSEGGITCTLYGLNLDEDKEMSPTVENFLVLTWLRQINPSLPQPVKQRYCTELRHWTLASIKPKISQAFPSLLGEIRDNMDARSFHTFAQPHHSRGSLAQRPPGSSRVVPVLFASKQSARVPMFLASAVSYLKVTANT